MKRRAYVETSIPSFFFETRPEPEMVARRAWTRSWWADSASVQKVTSIAVFEELRRGDFSSRDACMEMMASLPVLAVEPAIAEIVEAYIVRRVMPTDPAGDALHLAIASYHRCDCLVTWNCRQLANANNFGHIRRVNGLLGLFTPALVTPLELIGGDDDANSN